MNLDFLKPYLGDELFAQVSTALAKSGLNIVNIADGSYIPKAKFDEKLTKIDQLNADLATAQQQIKDEQAKNATVNDLQGKVTQLTADLAARDQQIAGMTMDYDIKDAVRASKPKDLDIVFGLLDRSKISKGDSGKLTGIDEQITALKESKGFLFESDKPDQGRGGFGGHQDILGGGGKDESTNAAVNNAIRQMAGRA